MPTPPATAQVTSTPPSPARERPQESVRHRPAITPLDDLPEFVLPEEAMHVLRIGRSKVYDLIRRGQLRTIRVGRLHRIHREELRRFTEPEK